MRRRRGEGKREQTQKAESGSQAYFVAAVQPEEGAPETVHIAASVYYDPAGLKLTLEAAQSCGGNLTDLFQNRRTNVLKCPR